MYMETDIKIPEPQGIQVRDEGAIGGLIRHARSVAGITQRQLAARASTTQPAISRWEHGHDEPRISTLADLLTACGLQLHLVLEPDEVDRAQICQQLAMTPSQRLESVTNLSRIVATARRIT